MVFGCASTNRFVVDPDLATSLQVESVVVHTEVTTTFDGAGGRVDLAAMTVEGTSNSGEPVVLPLAEVRRFYLRDDVVAPDAIKVNPQSLLEGGEWRPDGLVHHVALRSGEVLDLRKTPTTLDVGRRLLLCQPADDVATTIPFDQILYVQIRDDHPVRSSITFFGSAILLGTVALWITLANSNMGGMS